MEKIRAWLSFHRIMKQGQVEYYQVAAMVRAKETLERELRAPDSITDHYPKFLLTLDDDPPADYNGIKQLNTLDFLLAQAIAGEAEAPAEECVTAGKK